jgi:hypothetical protein
MMTDALSSQQFPFDRKAFNAHRGKGHDAYNAGRYGEAAEHYGLARDMLPAGSSARTALDQAIGKLQGRKDDLERPGREAG